MVQLKINLSCARLCSTILLIWFAGLGAAAQFSKISVSISEFRDLYPISEVLVGIALGGVNLFGVLLGLVAGGLAAKSGPKRVLVISLFASALISFWQAETSNIGFFLVSRFLEGIPHIFIVVAAPTLMAGLAPSKFKSVSLALWSTFFGVTFTLSIWLGPWLAANLGMEALFRVHGIYMMAIGALLILLPSGVVKQKHKQDNPSAGRAIPILVAWRSPKLMTPAIPFACCTSTFVPLITVFAERSQGAAGYQSVLYMPLSAVVFALVGVPLLSRYTSAVNVIKIGHIFMLLSGLAMFLGMSTLAVGVWIFCCLGLVQGACFIAVAQLNSSDNLRAIGNGILSQLGGLGGLVGAPVILIVASKSDVSVTVLFIVLLFFVSLLALCIASSSGQRRFSCSS
ncbi:MFS transporter [uncultured Ruegeria sp.]|uniref:MFS transporter n=1 Tax=uncultured Ruegeria sp. TaxID=259304 RepID=UPI0026293ECC|nr:MFS transporter [uncultured Ruegeria sp.]